MRVFISTTSLCTGALSIYYAFIPMKGDPQLFRGAADKATYKKAIDEFLLK